MTIFLLKKMLLRKNHRTKAAMATAVGTVLFFMVAAGMMAALSSVYSNQVNSSEELVSAQGLLADRQREYLAAYTISSGKILVSDDGAVQSELIFLVIVSSSDGSVTVCPSSSSEECTVAPSLPAVLAPSASVYFNINPAPSASAIIKIVTSLGNAFFVNPYPPPNTIQYYALTMSSSSQNGGTTGPSTGTYYYPAGIQVSITACAALGYSWNGWAGTGSGSFSGLGQGGQSDCPGSSPRHIATVTMDGNISETAEFSD